MEINALPFCSVCILRGIYFAKHFLRVAETGQLEQQRLSVAPQIERPG
jgi:hypothetical protein